jgi:hypothetical protein
MPKDKARYELVGMCKGQFSSTNYEAFAVTQRMMENRANPSKYN